MAVKAHKLARSVIEPDDPVKAEGTVKWFSMDKGYGFITDETDKDYYFAVPDVIGDSLPARGDSVCFEPKESHKGSRATRISILKPKSKSVNLNRRDICRKCGKAMVPRIITQRGALQRSVCPFCGCTHKDFTEPFFILPPLVLKIVGIAVACTVLFKFFM